MTVKTIALGALVLALAGIAALQAWRVSHLATDRAAWSALAGNPPQAPARFGPEMVADLPEPARRYFAFTIAEGTPIRTVARIEMTGQIGMGSRDAPGYRDMQASQVLALPQGFVWRLSAPPIAGSDAFTPRTSWTRFWLAGLVPVVRISGDPDHYRSAFGRLAAEAAFWTPAALLPGPGITWEAPGPDIARVTVRAHGLEQAVDIHVGPDGRPERVILQRWSNENPARVFREQPFGGTLSEFRQFDGYRLPTHVDGGNHIGTDDYFPFFRARVTDIDFQHLALR